MTSTIQPILDKHSLRWIFVGGKGGVGKTTTACSLAIQLAKCRKSVLLISTDPAHNISDAFKQQFGRDARAVEGVENLSAMEIIPDESMSELALENGGEPPEMAMGGGIGGIGKMIHELASNIPGIDEAMSFGEVLKQIKTKSYDVVVFDTAPTGHTLRFLQFPAVMQSALSKLSKLSQEWKPLLSSMVGLEDMMAKVDTLHETIVEVIDHFKDSDKTTFVCVCIPEFLSMYETERLIQELIKLNIDIKTIVVNQLLFLDETEKCPRCSGRWKTQESKLADIKFLYQGYNVIQMPQIDGTLQGAEELEKFSQKLVKPHAESLASAAKSS